MATSLTFDGNNLQTNNIITADVEHDSMGAKMATPYVLAHANGSVIPYEEYSSKVITLRGSLNAASISAMDSLRDTFLGYFRNGGKNLDIGYAGGTRRYVATATAINMSRPGGLTYATFEVSLLCLFGFGQDISPTTLVNLGNLTAGRTDNVTIGGNAPAQLLTTTITLNSFTGSGMQSISFGNNSNGQQITVSRVFAAGDVIQIDATKPIVTVNGLEVDFAGAFIEPDPGPITLAYGDSFSARNYSYSVTYNKRWF